MSAKTDFYGVLNAGVALAALVGERIYPDAIPEGVALPAVVWTSRLEVDMLLSGLPAASRTVFQVSAWGATRSNADEVADAVVAALTAADYPIYSRTDGFDPEVGAFSTALETDAWQ